MISDIYYDVRFDMPRGHRSLVFFIPKCNISCKYCDYKKLLKYYIKISIDEIDNIIQNHKNLITCITLSGGEPLLEKNLVKKIYEHCKNNNLYFCLFTNMLEIDSIQWLVDIIKPDKNKITEKHSNYESSQNETKRIIIYCDVKGTTIQNIQNNTNLQYDKAKKLLNIYKKYSTSDYIVYRVNENIKRNKLYKIFRNKEEYITL